MELDIQYMIKTFFVAMTGIPVTLKITAVALLAAAPAAFFMAVFKINRVRFLRHLITAYVSFIRGTPIVLQILTVYSLVPSFINTVAKNLGWKFNIFDVDPILYAYIVFSLNTVAGLSEIFRSALLTVSKGQLEAAYATGLTTMQAYLRIIIPQALTVALPNICNLTINLIKGTSLAFLMTVKDITSIAKIQASYGYNYIESYIDIFIIYILVCSITQWLFSRVEKIFGSYRAGTNALQRR